MAGLRRFMADDPPVSAVGRELVTMGRGSYEAPRVIQYRGSEARVVIGDWCSIALDVEFMTGGNHRLDWVSTYPFRIRMGLDGAFTDGTPWTKGDIVVGSDVWIGRGAKVLSGVTIGHGAVVGAYSVVVSDIEPFAVVAGDPARVVRHRFDAPTREALLRIGWWDWPEDLIRARLDQICSADLSGFIASFDPGVQGSI